MPKVKNIEKRIWDVEGFDVAFMQNGRNVSGAKVILTTYNFSNMAKNDMTIQEWKTRRFNSLYPGYAVEVLDADGGNAQGNTKLGTLRDTYSEEEK